MTLQDHSTSTKPLTRAEAARLLGCDVRTVDRAIHDGTIRSVRIGRKIYIPSEPFFALVLRGVC